MTLLANTLALAAVFAATAAYAQPAPRADVPTGPAPAQPGAQSVQTCPMMNGQRMMNGQAMGAHMQNGHMLDKDGKPIPGGMMGPKGMMCVPQVSQNAPPGKPAPKATP